MATAIPIFIDLCSKAPPGANFEFLACPTNILLPAPPPPLIFVCFRPPWSLYLGFLFPFSARRCPWSGHAVQKFLGLPGEDSSQRGVDGPLQGVRAMLAENGSLVPHFLAFIRENTEALWGQVLVTTAIKQNLNAML